MGQTHPSGETTLKSRLDLQVPPGRATPESDAPRGPLTHDLIGVAGRARLLSRFTSSDYTEQPALTGRRRFQRTDGPLGMVFEVDTVTGAIVQEEVRQDGHLLAQTSREYQQAGPLVLLEREVTTRFDAAGAPRERFERRLTNIRTERSR
jgi:hypothetical protein